MSGKFNIAKFRFGGFGVAANSRDLQIYIEGTALFSLDYATVKTAFIQDGWNVLDLDIISAASPYFRPAKVTITARVFNQYSDAQVLAKAREIMNQFLTVSQAVTVKGRLTEKEILGNDDFLNNIGLGLGLSTGTLIIIGVLGLALYGKILSRK